MKAKTLKLKPYARLLTMLGDQLIKNERVALGEIIKNAYDADASWVKLTFEGFDENFGQTATSKIIIEDNGFGMTQDIIENHWVNPATPTKLIGKQTKTTTPKGRVIQGEKGIGRFALLKLGRKIDITTRAKGQASELELTLDVSAFTADFIPKGGKPMFLDELQVVLRSVNPAKKIQECFVNIGARKLKRRPHGTRIEISHLTSTWSKAKVESIFNDMARLQSIFLPDTKSKQRSAGFELVIYRDDFYQEFATDYQDELDRIVHENSVLQIENGEFDPQTRTIKFDMGKEQRSFSLDDAELTGLKVYRDYLEANGSPQTLGQKTGPFEFAFYVFDFSSDAKGKFELDKDERKLIKEHRIYLYRDGIRVYPYGDKDDDWLGTDMTRGLVRASAFLSNDQVVGYVNITQKGNPDLKDKTSREGLIDNGSAHDDFILLLRIVLAWIRDKPFARYRARVKKGKEVEVFKTEQVQHALEEASEAAADNPALQRKVDEATQLYKAERRYLIQRAENTEHLAGVGLSVETASHDLMVALTRSLGVVDGLISQTQRQGALDKAAVQRDLESLRGILSFVQTQMKDVERLFKSSKQKRRPVRIEEMVEKVQRLFEGALKRAQIQVEVSKIGAPLVAQTTDAVVLQLLLNLYDNSLYWLAHAEKPRKILIELNGEEGTLVFSDNGPGIRREDAPYIFEPFYTGKGEEGRGLGLYIARQLLDRHEYSIALADLKAHKLLRGANFVVTFVKEE